MTGSSRRELPWFDRPDFAERVAGRSDLPEPMRSRLLAFATAGFVVIENEVPAALTDRAVAAFWRWIEADVERSKMRDPHGHYPRVRSLHMECHEVLDVFLAARNALALQDLLFEAETCLYSSLLFMRGSSQSAHRDAPHFSTVPEHRYFGMWVALEDVDRSNGPLMVIPGGHRIGAIDPVALAAEAGLADAEVTDQHAGLWKLYQERVEVACRAAHLGVEEVPMRKGDVLIWHPLLPHGGAPIEDLSRTRFSLAAHTTPVGTPVYQERHFFGYQTDVSSRASWDYWLRGERRIANLPYTQFGANIHPRRRAPAPGLG